MKPNKLMLQLMLKCEKPRTVKTNVRRKMNKSWGLALLHIKT